MEITKFRLQLSATREQVTAHLWQVRYKFRKLTRIAAERARKLGHQLMARSREAGSAANSKITKVKAQLSNISEQGTAHLRRAKNRLGGVTKSIAERLQKLAEELCGRGDELRVLLVASSREAVFAANSKITKVRAQLSVAFEQGTALLRQVQNRLGGVTRSIAAKRQNPPDAHEDGLRLPAARPREATAGAKKITEVKAQPPAALEQWTAHLLQVQNPLAGLARSIAAKPQKPPDAQEDGLRVPAARPREVIVGADSKVTKAKAQFSTAFEQGTARLRQAQKTLAGLGRNMVDRRQRRREELGARENQMHELLANSPDAIAVIDGDRRFVAANRRALDLFGVSEMNLSKFNIDVFLYRGQIPDFHRNGSFFAARQEKHGKCMIRRLDGSLRVAEFVFVTDFLPLHLCRFYDLCMPQRPTPMHHRIRPETPAKPGAHPLAEP